MTDKRKNNGGPRPNSGPKPIPEDEKKVTVIFYVKKKHVAAAKAKIQPIVDKLNKSKNLKLTILLNSNKKGW